MGAGQFQGTAQADGKVLNHDTLGADTPFGSRWFRGYLREQLGGVLMTEDIGQERVFKGGLAFSLDGQLLYDAGPGPFPHNVGGLAVNAQGGVATATLTPETFLAAIGLLNSGAMTEEHQPAGLFNEPLFQGIGYDFKDFRRATEALQFDRGVWKVIPAGFPRFEEGMFLAEPTRVNKCTNYNIDPDPNLTGILGDVIKSRTYAPDLIARAGLTGISSSGFVVDIFPSTSADTQAFIEGSTLSVNPHVGSIFVNTFGASLDFGIGENRGTFSTEGLERIVHKVPRPLSFHTLTFLLKNRQRIQFLLNQLEEGTVITSPIRTEGSRGTRDADSCRWEDPGGG